MLVCNIKIYLQIRFDFMKYLRLIFAIVLFASCENSVEIKSAEQYQLIKSRVENIDTNNLFDEIFKNIYTLNNYKLIGFDGDSLIGGFSKYYNDLLRLQDEGVDINVLPMKMVKHYIEKGQDITQLASDSIYFIDSLMMMSYIHAAFLLQYGNIKNLKDLNQLDMEPIDIANNFLYNIKKNNAIPSFDIYKPSIDLYSRLLFELKKWMKLSLDTTYLEAKEALKITPTKELALFVIKKEIPEIINLNEKELIIKYQTINDLKLTGEIDLPTRDKLILLPSYYRKKIKINLERLRKLNRNIDNLDYFFNTLNGNVYKLNNGELINVATFNTSNDTLLYSTKLVLDDAASNSAMNYNFISKLDDVNQLIITCQFNSIVNNVDSIRLKNITSENLNIMKSLVANVNLHKTYLSVGYDAALQSIVYYTDRQNRDAVTMIY
jgi:hypothetical protein